MKVVLDANVLYPATLRSLLLDLALFGMYEPHWTQEIQDEWQRNLLLKRPELSRERLRRTQAQMEAALPAASIHVETTTNQEFSLPDPNDTHVLMAARQIGANLIVTANLRDFPAVILGRYGIRAISPDLFLCALLHEDAEKVRLALVRQRDRYRNPPVTLENLLEQLAVQGVPEFSRQFMQFMHLDS